MTSGVSTTNGSTRYFWCLRHDRVETDDNMFPAIHRLGPYATAKEATEALERIAEREAQLDAEDARWKGEKA